MPLRLRSWCAALAVALAALGVGACSSGGASPPVPSTPAAQLPPSTGSHVVVVIMENKERPSVLGSRQAPYVNSLARRYAAPRNLFAIRHPSLPNYMALIGGSTFGVRSDCSGCNQSATNLVDQFEGAGIGWRAYMEGLPHPCFTGSSSGGYAKKHDPFAYFKTITADPARCANIVPASDLRGDLSAGRLPDFAWITPDLCNDTHDCSVAHGDRYLAKLIPSLLRELGPHGFLVLTWDEGTSSRGCCGVAHGGRIATVIAGPDVRRGARPAAAYSHYSTLRTIEDAFGLPPLRGAGAASTRPLDAAFKRPPRLRP